MEALKQASVGYHKTLKQSQAEALGLSESGRCCGDLRHGNVRKGGSGHSSPLDGLKASASASTVAHRPGCHKLPEQPAPCNYPSDAPTYHRIETLRPLGHERTQNWSGRADHRFSPCDVFRCLFCLHHQLPQRINRLYETPLQSLTALE